MQATRNQKLAAEERHRSRTDWSNATRADVRLAFVEFLTAAPAGERAACEVKAWREANGVTRYMLREVAKDLDAIPTRGRSARYRLNGANGSTRGR